MVISKLKKDMSALKHMVSSSLKFLPICCGQAKR
jgi:hypothetical protein